MTPLRYLLDTNACIAIRNNLKGQTSKDPTRQAAAQRLIDKCKALPASTLAMSFITLGELSLWAQKHRDAAQARQLLGQLQAKVTVLGLPVGPGGAGQAADVAEHYGAVRAELETAGERIGANDLWIAAHARSLGLTVVTGNTREFKRVNGLTVEDWTA